MSQPIAPARVVIEVFPKLVNDFVAVQAACERDCDCLGPQLGIIEERNRALEDLVRCVVLETQANAEIRVYKFSTASETQLAILRLNTLLHAKGFLTFEVDDSDSMQILEMITPAIGVGGALCTFATYPTKEAIHEALTTVYSR